MKKVLFGILTLVALTACQETLEERAYREAKEYTEKNCPTPPKDNAVTDSIVFDKATKTHWEYYKLVGDYDIPEAIAPHVGELKQHLLDNIINNPGLQPYKEAGFRFGYVVRSESNPKLIILKAVFGPKDYNTNPKKK